MPGRHDVAVFDRYRPRKPPTRIGSIYFGAAPAGSKVDVVGPGGAPLWTADQTVRAWNHEHPLLHGLKVKDLVVAKGLKLQAGNGWDVLVRGTDGPLGVAHQRLGERGGTVILSFNPSDSNWPLMVSFPVFLHRAVYWVVGAEANGGKERAALKSYFQP
jgi:hypothetical protein